MCPPARHALRFEPAPRRLLLLALFALLGLLGACASPPPAVGHLPAEPLGGLERTPLARIAATKAKLRASALMSPSG